MFALKDKSRFVFFCVSKTDEEFQRKINAAFSNWRGVQPKGSNKQIADFLEKYDKVIVTLESYNATVRRPPGNELKRSDEL
ncbi:MAG: hypothetical protein Q8L15_18400 [Methylobacter sp.]|nr:hypothetical protein [Methylobacter sp.]